MMMRSRLLSAFAAFTVAACAYAQPANDNCAQALAAGLGSTPFSNVGAGTEVTPNCLSSGADVWYTFDVPTIGTYVIDTCGANYDSTITVYDSCGGNVIACNDDSNVCGGNLLQSRLVVDAPGGARLFIRVAGYLGATGSGNLNIAFAGRPNDNCGSDVAAGLGTTPWNNEGATTDANPLCVSSGIDIWYNFTAPNRGAYDFNTCGSGFDTTITVYDACGGNILACNDDACGTTGLQSSVRLNDVAAGATLRVRLAGFSGRVGQGVLNISRVVPNDYCADAAPLALGATGGSLTLATPDGAASCGFSDANPDVWYTFTAPGGCPGLLMLNTCGSQSATGIDTVLSVYDACGGSQLACNDDSFAGFRQCTTIGGLDSSVAAAMQPGQTVRIRVSRYNSTTGTDFTLNAVYGYGNETCQFPAAVSNGTYNWSNCFASTDGPTEANCGFGFGDLQVNNDVWYVYNAASSGTLAVDTRGSGFDTKLAAYTSCPAGPNTAIACNDDSIGLQSYMEFNVTAGASYLIRAGAFTDRRGNGVLNIAFFCDADFNRDQVVDFFDYLDFVSAFAANQPAADFNNDGVIDFFDYLDFLSVFSASC